MASSAKYLSFLFLLFLISSLQIHARDSQFFSKVTREDNNTNNKNTAAGAAIKENELPESEEPTHTQDDEPSFRPQNHKGFGLYGQGSEQFSTNSVNDAYFTPTTEQYTPQNYEEKSFNKGYYPTNNYNYNGYENKQQGMRDTSFMDTAYNNNNNNNNNYNNYNNYRYGSKQQGMRDSRYVDTSYLNNNYDNGNEMKKQGMSDTRFLENGKYFYDVNNEEVYHDSYHNQYESPKETHNGYASASYKEVDQSRNRYNNYGGYHGNNANTYEFTNSMDNGFQNQGEEFQQSQEEYLP
ncbi:protein E6-like [Macadamia integrifolia]|uniref:protein E6-like n=1 Tax=Macadamia integrifolia TaxID=60698 RepID=UPI001C4F2F85|nr:protein E6-like [Macadamia integrifolia]